VTSSLALPELAASADLADPEQGSSGHGVAPRHGSALFVLSIYAAAPLQPDPRPFEPSYIIVFAHNLTYHHARHSQGTGRTTRIVMNTSSSGRVTECRKRCNSARTKAVSRLSVMTSSVPEMVACVNLADFKAVKNRPSEGLDDGR
jgi:hypothetical protein